MSQNNSKKYAKRKRNQSPKWLPFLVAAGGLLLIILACLCVRSKTGPWSPVEVKGSPSLKVDKNKIDLGDVKLGQTVQVSFQLTNVGDKTLRLAGQPYVEVVEGC